MTFHGTLFSIAVVFGVLTIIIVYLSTARRSFTKNHTLIDATECGHKTKIKGSVSAFGHTTVTELPINAVGSTEYCHECLEKMAIRCAWCGDTIFIGDPITLYSPSDQDKIMPDHAVLYNKEQNSYVGCLRWDCAETGADRAGFWHPPGVVLRVPTAFEMIESNIAEGNYKPIFISDLSKP